MCTCLITRTTRWQFTKKKRQDLERNSDTNCSILYDNLSLVSAVLLLARRPTSWKNSCGTHTGRLCCRQDIALSSREGIFSKAGNQNQNWIERRAAILNSCCCCYRRHKGLGRGQSAGNSTGKGREERITWFPSFAQVCRETKMDHESALLASINAKLQETIEKMRLSLNLS